MKHLKAVSQRPASEEENLICRICIDMKIGGKGMEECDAASRCLEKRKC